ncbi:hypothetical protein K439DRAFT_71446 [Ramaria rubella]|nr:hypothetical protein K439DRAFT_71446 [Ramaria rubella]
MALNAALSIRNSADKVLRIIETEIIKATERWKREHEAQKRLIEQLTRERDAALAEAQKTKEETRLYQAEMQRCKEEIERHKKLRNETQRQLLQTQARFSLTIVPVGESVPTGSKRPASALHTPSENDTAFSAETPSCNVYHYVS